MRTMQTSYAAGVLAPSLHARVDLAKWQIGLAEANNMLVHVHGGISNRPGLVYRANTKDDKKPRFVPFEYSTTDTLFIEFTDMYMRLVQDGVASDFPANQNGWLTESVIVEDGADDFFQAPNPQHEQVRYRMTFNLEALPASGYKLLAACGIAVHSNGIIYLARARESDGHFSEVGSAWFTSTGQTMPLGEEVTLEVHRDGDKITVSRPGQWSWNYTTGSTYHIPCLVPLYTHLELGHTGNHFNTFKGAIDDSGTTDGGAETTTLTDSTSTWTIDQYVGYWAYNTTSGKQSRIVSNTATVITVDDDLGTSNGDSYEIVESTNLTVMEYSAITPADGYVYRLLPEVSDPGTNLEGCFQDSLDDAFYYNRDAVTNLYPLDLNGEVVVIPDVASPYAEADLFELRYVQREAVLYFTHPSYPEYSLTRYADHWEMEQVSRTPELNAPENLTGEMKNQDGTTETTASEIDFDIEYQVAAITEAGEESSPSELITVGGKPSASWTAGNYVGLSWDPVPDADLYVVYKNSRGYFGYIGSTTGVVFNDDNIAPDSADGPKTYRDPLSGVGNYPKTVGIYQQRKAYGGSNSNPQTTWLTQSGTMDNLSVSRPLKDNDAITAQLDSNQVNQILHFVPMKDLVVITNNGVWTLSSGANSDALTPTTTRYDLESSDGGSYLRPIVSGNTVLMVPNFRNGAKELFYQIQSGGFEGNDLHLLANHLFKTDKVVDWAYQRDDSIVWCVMDSGTLCSLTYLRSHDVVAWTTHDTQGTFEAVVVIKQGDRDVPYFGVLRTIDGSQVRFIEALCERLPGDVLEDSCFLDAALSYDGAATDSFTGATHLANTTCTVLADGNVIQDVEVNASGEFTLSHAYSKVHVGLGYAADFETLDVDYQGQEGPGFGNLKNITEVTLAMEKTRGISVGPTDGDLTEMKFRTDEGYDEHTRMFTGKKDIAIEPMWGTNGRIHVRQAYPLPVTILSHVPEVHPGDE